MCSKINIDNYIEDIIGIYNSEIGNMETLNRGELRQAKGDLVESITPLILRAAWKYIGGSNKDFKYIDKNQKVTIYKKNKCRGIKYKLELDGRVLLNNKNCIVKEDKAYIDTSMYKRALQDFDIYRKTNKNSLLICIALEEARNKNSKKVLESYFDFKPINIILLKDNRSSSKEISRPCNFKELSKESLIKNIKIIGKAMEKFL